MKLVSRRFEYGNTYTISRLYINDTYECFVLEDKVRDTKIFGETAIPIGTYKVIVDYSKHFNKELPHILDVPGFEGVRIHSGNTAKDTEGCLLVGTGWGGAGTITNSRVAFNHLFKQILSAIEKHEEVTIEIQDTR